MLWHFVLVQTTDVNSGELTAEFQNAGTIGPITYYKASGGVLHWNIVTPTDDVLLSASTTADSAKENGLNLSHVCSGRRFGLHSANHNRASQRRDGRWRPGRGRGRKRRPAWYDDA